MRKLAYILFVTCAAKAVALPAYSRLFQAKYGYRPSCVLCHSSGGGSSVNSYGRDFLRAGANYPAFAKIENKDSDQDGTLNLGEINVKASPADATSVPNQVGDWLLGADRAPIPEKDLRKLFPDAEAFSVVEGTLKDAQILSIEGMSNMTLREEDRVPTFYFAIRAGKKVAVAQFVSAPSSKGPISVAVSMDTDATVTGVRILKNPATKGIEEVSFLSQFAGKKRANEIEIGKGLSPAKNDEAVSREIALAVKKAVLIINSVFGKQ